MSTKSTESTSNDNQPPEMTRLKRLWLKMPDAKREEWLDIFDSGKKLAYIRSLITARLNINLGSNFQLTRFVKWTKTQANLEIEAQAMEKRQAELLAQGMTLVQAQETILREAAARALAEEDYALGTRVSAEITRFRAIALAREKFEFSAAKACLKVLPELKVIASDETLTEAQKTEAFITKIFGPRPKKVANN